MVAPAPPVPPRAYAPESGAPLPLDDLIDPAGGGVVALIGGPGSGKTTAVAYLRARLEGVAVLDEPSRSELVAESGPTVYAAEAPARMKHSAILQLAPWGHDELLQYLEARWPDRLRSVMSRILKARDRDLPEGVPELWSAALDAMAEDGDVDGIREAWRRSVPPDVRPETRRIAFRLLRTPDGDPAPATTGRLLRHRSVCAVFAAEHLAETLREGNHTLPEGYITPELLRETALLADEDLVARLEDVLASDREQALHPLAASVVFATKPQWRPRSGCRLKAGHFPRAQWAGIDLSGCDLRGIRLPGAELRRARLREAVLTRARLSGACLADAGLARARLLDADLSRADLTRVRANQAGFDGADLSQAILEGGHFGGSQFGEANLSRARCAAADFSGATIVGADFTEADFTDACFDRAALAGADLRRATWTGATFVQARLTNARLDGAGFAGANLAQARLVKADLTDADLETADLRGASLRGARAGGVNLMQANLSGADLREIQFHFGTTRSGLLSSPTAMEGSMTGYYADDDDLAFRAPEELRTANLCGADLRGALLDGTDFWRVDLRGARLDPDQVAYVRRCGAIL